MQFDNATGASKPMAQTQGDATSLDAPAGLPTAAGSYVQVDIAVDAQAHPAWKEPVRTWFRREGAGWKLVGLERMPDKPRQVTVAKT
jgi:hypothetical protein